MATPAGLEDPSWSVVVSGDRKQVEISRALPLVIVRLVADELTTVLSNTIGWSYKLVFVEKCA